MRTLIPTLRGGLLAALIAVGTLGTVHGAPAADPPPRVVVALTAPVTRADALLLARRAGGTLIRMDPGGTILLLATRRRPEMIRKIIPSARTVEYDRPLCLVSRP